MELGKIQVPEDGLSEFGFRPQRESQPQEAERPESASPLGSPACDLRLEED